MKMIIFLLIIFTSNFYVISPNYTFELIEELIPKNITLEETNLNSFKIFKYIPSCQKNENYTKGIYLQTLTSPCKETYYHIYIYDNFSKIAQNSKFQFINSIDVKKIFRMEESFLFSDLNCTKEYFFVISISILYSKISDFPYLISQIFNIIDAKNDIIKISPESSDIFSFHQRNDSRQETIFYSFKEKKNALIVFSSNANVKILKNDKIIYVKGKNDYKKEILFEQNENYTILFMGYPNQNFFSLQLFNEAPISKYDFKNGPILLYYLPLYYFEIDISKFEIDDNILLDYYSSSTYSFKYQYKSNFNGNNFKYLGRFNFHNYIPIKNIVKDSSIIISIEVLSEHHVDFSILNIIPKFEEINSEFNQEIKGPKYYFIDYNKFNNMNSIGFLANESFLLYEVQSDNLITQISKKYFRAFITTLDNYALNIIKSAIIYFNSTNNILFEVKKYNYPFLEKNDGPNYEYFQLCQGNDTLDELYFSNTYYEIFQPVFGTFDSYYIKLSDIKTSSDLDFDNKELSNNYKINFRGFLKIKCKAPLMLKHTFLLFNSYSGYSLNSGQKYYLDLYYSREYTLDKDLINKDLKIKITIFGLEPNKYIQFFFNNKIYNLTNKPFEMNFTYEEYSHNLFRFKKMEKDDDTIIVEINVGILPENINKTFKEIDFNDSFGTLNIDDGKNVIIKIPKNFTEDLFDSLIIFEESYYSKEVYIDISYDKIEFQTRWIANMMTPPSLSLFKVNPYNYIKNDLLDSESNNKNFYIILYGIRNIEIYIRKPLIYLDTKFNTINYLPALAGNKNKYYYQIQCPKPDGNYSYLSIQTPRMISIRFALSKQNIKYPLFNRDSLTYNYFHYFIIPIDKRQKNNLLYFNYYYTDNPGYINFIQTNDKIDPYKKSTPNGSIFVKKIQQVIRKNELMIELDSLSYKYNKNIVKYYLFINFNLNNSELSVLYSIISGYGKPNETKNEFMAIIEDNGLNKTISKKIGINTDLDDDDKKIFIIPIFNDTNLILEDYISVSNFYFKYIPKEVNLLWYILIIIIIAILLYIIIRKKCNKGIRIDKLVEEELSNIEK